MSIDKEIFERLRLVVGAFTENDCLLLARAMRYADEETYTAEPKSINERILNEIFEIKAASYYKRKKLEYLPTDNRKAIHEIRDHEHFSISILKRKLPI